MPEPVTQIIAPAKTNLALAVAPPDACGMHPICSWMVTLDLCDELILREANDQTHFEIDWADDAPVKSPIDWPIEKDLAYRAWQAVQEAAGRAMPVVVTLRKRIPTGGGLGGGSSDAAAMLRAMANHFQLDWPASKWIELASGLGSDVPFFLTAGSAIIEGLGEQITEMPLPENLHLTLILPPIGCHTGQVYKTFDKLNVMTEHTLDCDKVRQITQRPLNPQQLFNDLADPAWHVAAQLAELRDHIAHDTQQILHLSGSGSTMFIICESRHDAERMAMTIDGSYAIDGLPVRACAVSGRAITSMLKR